jgi:hypothetical protein
MSILTDFEDRVGGALEGMFAGVFRSPVQPVEIARALGKAMDDGRTVGVGKVYVPVAYTVALSPEDTDNLGGFTATLSGELATFLVDHAREHGYHLGAKPQVRFIGHDDLRLGRFRVSAELAFAAEGARAEAPTAGEAAVFDIEQDEMPGPSGLFATVTVADMDHDVALRGERMVIGRLQECDICLADANASRRHAAFVRDGDEWLIEDLGSTNGTSLDSRPVTREVLHDGDTVEIGLTRLTFHRQGR